MKKIFITAAAIITLSLFSAARADTYAVPCRIAEHGGIICVFKESGEMYSTGIPVKFLPPDDRERLAEGIVIDSEDELLQILEDFGS